MKYRLKTAAGEPVDKSIEQTWRRVARALAKPEQEPKLWAKRFYEALEGFQFLPAGRILAGAGTGRNVTLFNCFVMGSIPDDMGGIFEHLKEAALTMQQGGGIGYDFSTLRPRGAAVKGIGADASGPLSFMDVWDAMCRTILSAGSRRGAMMATLRCDHPDIEDFIEAKSEPGRLRMFNLSVLVTDAFMQAVKEDAPWELKFADTVYRSVPARALWDRIMRATYAYAEPGVIFIDRINRRNNLWYCEEIHSTNPCVAADVWVQTTEGPRQVRDLLGRLFTALVDGRPYASGPEGFFKTGTKPVLRMTTREGWSLRVTADHPVRRVARMTPYVLEAEWIKAGELVPGDKLVLHDHSARTTWPGRFGEAEGYLIGLLVGDGTLKQDKAVLSVWPGRAVANGQVERPGVLSVMQEAVAAARSLPHRADFRGWIDVPGRGEARLSLAAVRHLAGELGLRPGAKAVTPDIERASSAFYGGFLRGLFDADGSVQGDQRKGVSIRLAQSDAATLEAVQRMLLRLGIVSRLYLERRPAGHRSLPDGRGGTKRYLCAADHELVISSANVARFAERVGFTDAEKAGRLRTVLASYRRRLNKERFVARLEAIVEDGVEAVYDTHIAEVHAFDANGFYLHNCGEQPLPPYGACLLGSINLAALVERPFEDDAALDLARLEQLVPLAVRMLDNAIDCSRFALPQQKHEALAKRRIGLGVTGLGDALIMCGARYGSAEAVELTGGWMKALRRAAYLASAELAGEKGAFPLFDKDLYLRGESIDELERDLRDAIAAHGIRNALVTSVAPTGTVSLLADNISSGLEPVFAFSYNRSVLQPDGTSEKEEVSDFAYRLYRRLKGAEAPLTEAFVDSQSLEPSAHVVMQATVQSAIDSSVSKTINLPAEISFEAFKDVYGQAYALGCKGCTTYRPNPVTGAVLEAPSAAEVEPLPAGPPAEHPAEPAEAGAVIHMTQPLARPEALPGRTYKLRWPESDHATYITINDVMQDARRRPFEIFINSKNMEHYAWTLALTRMISAVFRRGGDVSFVVEELKAVFDPRGGAWLDRKYVPSLLAAIGEVIERHMIDIGFLPTPHEVPVKAEPAVVNLVEGPGRVRPQRQIPNARDRPAPMRRLCRQFRAELGVDDDACPVCGALNPVPLPWYTPVLGAVMLAVIVWLLVDVDALVRLFERD
jgi:ribonucleoside-diphosphate reductase alpha chain